MPKWVRFGVDMVVEQANTLAGKFVDSRSRCVPDNPASVKTEFAPTEVVDQDENNVRLAALGIKIRVQPENESRA
jgi:hypothetical protein